MIGVRQAVLHYYPGYAAHAFSAEHDPHDRIDPDTANGYLGFELPCGRMFKLVSTVWGTTHQQNASRFNKPHTPDRPLANNPPAARATTPGRPAGPGLSRSSLFSGSASFRVARRDFGGIVGDAPTHSKGVVCRLSRTTGRCSSTFPNILGVRGPTGNRRCWAFWQAGAGQNPKQRRFPVGPGPPNKT